jgi:acyl-CoA synthetase (AMP-forming)/AMP-acid ligase II
VRGCEVDDVATTPGRHRRQHVIYRSDRPEPAVPPALLSQYVLRDAAGRGDKVALVDALTGESTSYAELVARADAGAAGLVADGLGPGDVVAVISHNQPSFAVAVHAVLRAGCVVSPLNPVLTAGEIGKLLGQSAARAVIAADTAVDKVLESLEGSDDVRVYVLGEHPRARSFAAVVAAGGTPPALDLDPATALAALPFSSGTTGAAKGVMLSHRNLVANLEQLRAGWQLTEDDVVCAVLPFFHIYGFTLILNSALLAGMTVVTMPRFGVPEFLRAVQDHGVTRGHFAPPMVLALVNAPEVDDYDVTSLGQAMCGAAPLDEELAARAERRLGCVIRQGYGMTEASPGTHMVCDDRLTETPAGSIGELLAGTEARLVDPATGDDVEPGAAGELLVRGPQVMLGYLDDPAATAETITDGWLHTGDIARVDERGDWYVVDRLKELIKYKGYQVAPAELEAVLLTHPDVLDAAVVAMPHPTGGEAPKAFVVVRRPVPADELMAFVADRVAPYKKVRAVEFIEQIPKSPAGKILRRVLRTESGSAGSP